MLISGLDELLRVAAALFDQIRSLQELESGKTALPLYEHWLREVREMLPLLRTAKRIGCHFTQTPTFMRANLEAQAVVASGTGAIGGGDTKSLDEVELELSHRG